MKRRDFLRAIAGLPFVSVLGLALGRGARAGTRTRRGWILRRDDA